MRRHSSQRTTSSGGGGLDPGPLAAGQLQPAAAAPARRAAAPRPARRTTRGSSRRARPGRPAGRRPAAARAGAGTPRPWRSRRASRRGARSASPRARRAAVSRRVDLVERGLRLSPAAPSAPARRPPARVCRRFSEAISCCSASSSRAGPVPASSRAWSLSVAGAHLLDVRLQPGDVAVEVVDGRPGRGPARPPARDSSRAEPRPARRARAGCAAVGELGQRGVDRLQVEQAPLGLRVGLHGRAPSTGDGACSVHGSVSRSETTVSTPKRGAQVGRRASSSHGPLGGPVRGVEQRRAAVGQVLAGRVVAQVGGEVGVDAGGRRVGQEPSPAPPQTATVSITPRRGRPPPVRPRPSAGSARAARTRRARPASSAPAAGRPGRCPGRRRGSSGAAGAAGAGRRRPSRAASASETPGLATSALVCATNSAMPALISRCTMRPLYVVGATDGHPAQQQRMVRDDQVGADGERLRDGLRHAVDDAQHPAHRRRPARRAPGRPGPRLGPGRRVPPVEVGHHVGDASSLARCHGARGYQRRVRRATAPSRRVAPSTASASQRVQRQLPRERVPRSRSPVPGGCSGSTSSPNSTVTPQLAQPLDALAGTPGARPSPRW